MSFQVEVAGDAPLARNLLRSPSGTSQGLRAKSWSSASSDKLRRTTAAGAAEAGLDYDSAMRVVRCTTRFAVFCSVVIAILELTVYGLTGREVLRTSALDSLGEIFGTCITLLTGRRMERVDKARFPVGQAKIPSIGCLIFSTFMFALMVGNALGNLESLMESKDEVGKAAISRFFYETKSLGGSFAEWGAAVYWSKDRDEFEWRDDALMANPVKHFFSLSNDPDELAMGQGMLDMVTKGDIVGLTAEYSNEAQEKKDLVFQNVFLSFGAAYKLFMFLFCICYAVPKSRSTVVVALGTDQRNDFIGKASVIVATSLAYLTRDDAMMAFGLIPEEKVDPLVSLLMSCFIMYSWSGIIVEHMTTLSEECSPTEFCSVLRERIQSLLTDSPCSVLDEDIKAYMSSGDKHTIEVALSVENGELSFKEVAKVLQQVQTNLEALDDVERVILTIKS